MKRRCIVIMSVILLSLSVLIWNGCGGNDEQKIKEVKVNDDITVYVESGSDFGCQFVLYISGFGYCYNLDSEGFDMDRCEVKVGNRISIEEEYSEQERQSLYPYRDDCLFGYPVGIVYEGGEYNLGLLRYFPDSDSLPYGVPFDFLSQSDPHSDIKPCRPMHKNSESFDSQSGGYLRYIDIDNRTAEIKRVELSTDAEGFTYEVSAESDTTRFDIAEDAYYLVCAFDYNAPYMVVKETAFITLWEGGYDWICEAPCRLIVDDETLLGVVEICNP